MMLNSSLSGILRNTGRIDFVLGDQQGDPGIAGLDYLPGVVSDIAAVHREAVAEYIEETMAFEAEFHATLIQDEIQHTAVSEA